MIPNEEEYVDDSVVDLSTYNRAELLGVIDLDGLNIIVTDEMTDDEIREAIMKASEEIED